MRVSVFGGNGNALLSHDRAILRSGFRAAFATPRDWFVFVAGVALILAAGASLVADRAAQGWSPRPWVLLLPLSLTGAMVAASVERRLAHFAEHSALAWFALERGSRVRYTFAYHGGGLAIGLLGLLIVHVTIGVPSASTALLLALPAYALGVLTGTATLRVWDAFRSALRGRRVGGVRSTVSTPLPAGRDRRLLTILIRRPLPFAPSLDRAFYFLVAVGVALGGVLSLLLAVLPSIEALVLGLVPPLAVLLLLSRIDAATILYCAVAGHGPLRPALAPALAAGLFLLALVATLAALHPARAVTAFVIGGALLIVFTLIALLRGLHYRLRSRRAADFAFQIDVCCMALAALLFPPLAAIYLVWRLVLLGRRAGAVTWLHP